MKPVPPAIDASGPEGTQWFGGAVDRSSMTLRVGCSAEECETVSRLLNYSGSTSGKRWRLPAPDSVGSNLDEQVQWILSRLTPDIAAWKRLAAQYKIDLFCGLFLERSNRGVTLRPETMRQLAEREIELGFDIYAPDDDTAEQAAPSDARNART